STSISVPFPFVRSTGLVHPLQVLNGVRRGLMVVIAVALATAGSVDVAGALGLRQVTLLVGDNGLQALPDLLAAEPVAVRPAAQLHRCAQIVQHLWIHHCQQFVHGSYTLPAHACPPLIL